MAKTILMIDDDIDVLRFMVDSLQSEGFQVIAADGGPQALGKIKNKPIDLIVLDYNMPVVNGVQTLEMLRRSPETKKTPVIFLTGQEIKTVQIALELYSNIHYLRKPVALTELHTTVKKIFNPPAPVH